MTLTPSYGRDYNSVRTVKEAFFGGKDFTIASMGPDSGRYVTCRELKGRTSEVTIRYSKLRKVVVVDLEDAPE